MDRGMYIKLLRKETQQTEIQKKGAVREGKGDG